MKNKSYLKNNRRKSIASIILAFLLVLTFNSSPILLLSESVRKANAYKSSQTQVYYSSSTSESEANFSDASYPSSLSDYFSESKKNFNILSYYNTIFDDTFKTKVNEFYSSLTENGYHTKYVAFLDSCTNLSTYFSEHETTIQASYDISSFKLFAESLLTGINEIDVDLISSSISSISGENVKYKKLSRFYCMLANSARDESVSFDDINDEELQNNKIESDLAFYNSNSHYLRLKEYIENTIAEKAPTYAFDKTTQDTNVAAIIANNAPESVQYNYVSNSYVTYNEPATISYAQTKPSSSSDSKNTVYYFLSSSNSAEDENYVKSHATYLSSSEYFKFETKAEKATEILYYRQVKNGEFGYIDSTHPTYYKFSNLNFFLGTSPNFTVYVLNNNPSVSQLDTYSSIFFKTMTEDERDQELEFYYNIPYDETYFQYIYDNTLFKLDTGLNFTFSDFLSYFSESGESKLYFKLNSNERKEVYIDDDDYNAFINDSDNANYAYHLNSVNITPANEKDFTEITPSYSGYYSSKYTLYFQNTKEYYTETNTTYNGYEEEKSVIVDFEMQNIPSKDYEMVSNQKKIYVVSDDATVEINSITYAGVTQSTIDENKYYYVAVPASVYTNNNIDSNIYNLYYKHTSVSAKKLYVVDDLETAPSNEIYKVLNYNVITSSDFKESCANYKVVESTDSNYNKNFMLYYKYNRTEITSQFYVLTDNTSIQVSGSTYKKVGSGELIDYILIDETANASIYNDARTSADLNIPQEATLKLYYKLSNVFVQNELKKGNAIYILDSSITTTDKENYTSNSYTPISQTDLDNNPSLYVEIDSNDINYSTTEGVKLYYKYPVSNDLSKVVYSIDKITTTDNDFDANMYELINNPLDENYVEGKELYYKKIAQTSTTNITKNTSYIYQTSTTVSLEANSYYVVSFYVYTVGNAQASFVIKDTSKIIDDISLSNISTVGKWEQYNIFISTDSFDSSKINLYLLLGDQEHGIVGTTGDSTVTGSIFFDEIKITKIGITDFNTRSIDAVKLYSTLYKIGNEEQTDQYADKYNNRVYIANSDSRFATNTYEYKNYINNSMDVYDTYTWDEMFNFDLTSLQTNILGRETAVEEEKIENQLVMDNTINNYNLYDSSFNTLWRYYIARDIDTDFKLLNYRQAYMNGDLGVTITNQIEKPNFLEEDETTDENDDDDEISEVKYIESAFHDGNYALKLTNTNKNINLGITSNSFKVEQFGYYKISLWIYSPKDSGKATIGVNSILKTKQSPVYGNVLTKSVDSVSANTNIKGTENAEYCWIPITLYIEGNNFKDMDCYLYLVANSDSTIYFDNIKIQKITSAQYDAASSNTDTSCNLSLISGSAIVSSGITNGCFDNIKETSLTHSVSSIVPYEAESWTVQSNSSTKVIAGVVSTKYNPFFSEYSTDINKIPTEENDEFSNIYAIYAPSTVKALDNTNISYLHNYSIYSSTTSNLSSGKIYKITFRFYKTGSFTGNLISKLYISSVKDDNIVSEFNIPHTEIGSGWQTYTYYYTASSDQKVYIEIGVSDAQGLCYFKNIASTEDTTENSFETIVISEAEKAGVSISSIENIFDSIKGINFVNLKNDNFDNHEMNQNDSSDFYDQSLYVNEAINNDKYTVGKSGVVVASYYDTISTTTHSVVIDDTVYYIGEIYKATIDNNDYYVKKTYNSAENKNIYKIYSDESLKNIVTKINDKDAIVEIISDEVSINVDSLDYPTIVSYKLYKYKNLTEEITEIDDEKVTISDLSKVVVGEGTKATDNEITTTKNKSYVYKFNTTTKKDYVSNNTIVPSSELNNNHSSSVLVLSNNYTTDYISVEPLTYSTLGVSSYKILRIYVKTSDFNKENYGLNIKISAVNVSWTNINTTNAENKDEYGFVCYEVLVKTNSADSVSNFGVELSLGTENDTTVGYAIISKISLDSFADENEFNNYSSLVGDDNDNIEKVIYNDSETEEEPVEEEADDKNTMSWATFFYVFSSILLVVTMAVALVAIILKKHPLKFAQKFENEHDRDIETIPSKSNKNKKETETPNSENKNKGGII